MLIREWVERQFGGSEPTMILELGAHQGEDTVWLADLPNVTVHAFEPDRRVAPPWLMDVTLHRMAISDQPGRVPLLLSEPTKSSSLLQPKRHLELNPQVRFSEYVPVHAISLDAFVAWNDIGHVDLIWADVQGAERKMLEGGRQMLARTDWLYTEYSDHEEYEGQPTLDEILAMLPDWKIEHQWPYDVLLGRVA